MARKNTFEDILTIGEFPTNFQGQEAKVIARLIGNAKGEILVDFRTFVTTGDFQGFRKAGFRVSLSQVDNLKQMINNLEAALSEARNA